MTEPFTYKSSRQYMCFNNTENLIAGITTRKDGFSKPPFHSFNLGLHVPDEYSAVLKNRKQLAMDLNVPLTQWVMGEQVHQTKIKVITPEDLGKGVLDHDTAVKGVDGLITNIPDVLLTAFYADCVPLYFLDEQTRWIGIAHAGWKGTVQGMAQHMIEKFNKLGADLSTLKMVIGPSIGFNQYEVDEQVINQVPAEFREEAAISLSEGKYLLDLKKLNQAIAVKAGLADDNISMTGYCTYEEEDLFFSHRRDHGSTGRMLGYIGWKR
ncbi:peptidoglycan editing factor PgeF [Halobacillus rhizosphaerae]|uniref:peptidoglycan editing factor PgeF n=1 Tax=Halobacillus rhizosphaerae TaxID=3064889 RepID=UPI00398AD9A5